VPLYFAYGLNLDRETMAQRCPGARVVGPARLMRHRFVITRDGWASVVRDVRACVHGGLWELTLGDLRALDRFEDVGRGLYVKVTQPVVTSGGAKRALVYVGTGAEGGMPKSGYLERIMACAPDWDMPEAHLRALSQFLPQGLRGTAEVPAPRPAVQPRAEAPVSTINARPR
jgi:gamma-glutamylcyclotransferase (GGCT)/AIG2-like uncharacterized protein YtfP